jgi:thiamine pyrophosphokinase
MGSDSETKRALLFTGGELGDVVSGDLPNASLVLAADSGLHHARAVNIAVDLLVGDLDSVDERFIGNTPIQRHSPDKDASDTELAVEYAIDQGCNAVTIVGGVGGRVDHWLGLLLGLCRDEWRNIGIDAIMSRARIYVVRDFLRLHGHRSEVVSMFAANGDVHGLHINGLKWSGSYDVLPFGSSLGLSNELVSSTCEISLESGTLLVIHNLGERTSVSTSLSG